MNISNSIIQGCKDNNPMAQKCAYDILLPYLNSICRRYLPYTTNRNDALQESFIKIFTKIHQYNPQKGEFKSWCTKITINSCLQYCNKVTSRNETELTSNEYQIPINQSIFSKLTNDEVLKVLSKMPLEYFQVFNLFILDGFSHNEIAELLGIKSSLSRKRLARARDWISRRTELNSMVS